MAADVELELVEFDEIAEVMVMELVIPAGPVDALIPIFGFEMDEVKAAVVVVEEDFVALLLLLLKPLAVCSILLGRIRMP